MHDFLKNWARSRTNKMPTTDMTVVEHGPPSLLRQLRGRFVLRHKGKSRRRHAFKTVNDLVLVRKRLLKNVIPVSGGHDIAVEDSVIKQTITLSYQPPMLVKNTGAG